MLSYPVLSTAMKAIDFTLSQNGLSNSKAKALDVYNGCNIICPDHNLLYTRDGLRLFL